MTEVNDPQPEQPINPWTLKEAVFEVMPEAKEAAGAICAARTLMYKVRPRIQKYTDRELVDHYFTQHLLPQYQREVGPLEGVYYEPRGVLVHPHDDEGIVLGTREVEGYELPSYQFDKILYIEKTGLQTQLAPYQLAQKYDMAIIYGSGFSVVACRELLAYSESPDMTVFVLHDGDWSGYDIGRTLGEPTERMPDHDIEVIEMGLTVQQAIDEGLDSERVIRKKALPAGVVFNEVELSWFGNGRPLDKRTGRPAEIDEETGLPIDPKAGEPTDDPSKFHYDCRRCELNAFSADGLAAFIEAQLHAHGVTAKVVPPPEVLDEFVESAREVVIDRLVRNELARMVDIDAVVSQLLERHPELIGDIDEERVREWFAADEDNLVKSWRRSAASLVSEDIDAVDGFTGSVRARIREQLDRE